MTSSSSSTSCPLILTSGASGRVNAIFSLRALKGLVMLINAFLLVLLVPFRVKKRNTTSSITTSSSSSSSSMAKESKDDDDDHHHHHHHHYQKQTKVLRVSYHHHHHRRSIVNMGVTEDRDVMMRRSIAIRKVNEDDDGKSSVRDVSMFVTSRGETLFTQSWTPLSNQIK